MSERVTEMRGWVLRDAQVPEDGPDDGRVGEEGENPHLAVAGRAPKGVHLVDAGEQLRPATAWAAVGSVAARGDERGGPLSRVRLGTASVGVRVLAPVPRRLPPVLRVRGEDAVAAVPVDTRRRDQACEAVEQLERAEPDPGASVTSGSGKLVDGPPVGRPQLYTLPRPDRTGRTAIQRSPIELLQRLARLIPPGTDAKRWSVCIGTAIMASSHRTPDGAVRRPGAGGSRRRTPMTSTTRDSIPTQLRNLPLGSARIPIADVAPVGAGRSSSPAST